MFGRRCTELGITDAMAASLGIRVYKVGLTWPLEPQRALAFADGLHDILVVEEKRSFVESQLARLLYNVEAARRPSIAGKFDETGAPLLPSIGELTPTMVARAVVARLRRLTDVTPFEQRLARIESYEKPAAPVTKLQRTPFFCSGCPHNTSTRVPEGSRAMAGIGCHSMALFMPGRETATTTQMGGEGANWIGQAPFTSEQHVFQNLGDGTYAHSGLMAIRAAAVAGVNITYKILYNDAVAMTGGQPVEGAPTVAQIAQQVLAEGAKRVVVVAEEPEKYSSQSGLPGGVTVRDRDDLDAVQRELRDVRGLTVLIYDQTCAAEKRRRRKRGTYPDPAERVFINDLVCEGCGDCSVKSNCISVMPVETEFGRKRQIDQSNCNKDFSCLKGFCPSFVTVRGATPRKLGGIAAADGLFAKLKEPKTQSLDRPYSILVTGIGGTGVVTLGALLGMAAHLEGKGCTVLDISGLAQKNGAVMSHIRLAPDAGSASRRPHRDGRRGPAARLRSGGRSKPRRTVAYRQRHDARRPQQQCAADRGLRVQSGNRFRSGEDACGDQSRGARRRHYRRQRTGRSADGRFDRRKPVHARLCLPERPHTAQLRRDRSRHRAQSRRRRKQPAQFCLGPAGGGRSCAGRSAGAQ